MAKKTIPAVLLSVALFFGAGISAYASEQTTAASAPVAVTTAATHETVSRESRKQKLAPDVVININLADPAALVKLERIGQKRAEDIIAWRKQHGPFKSVGDLSKVKGISAKIVQDNKAHLKV